MERQTFERALHAWDKWHDSIEQSRNLLDYDPKWPRDTCINWIEKHYPEIRKQAEDELRRLELPPTLYQYWEDCLYSDYKTQGGRTDYNKITRRLAAHKSLPELPCDHGVVWYDRENIHDPWLRVEIRLHARFATKELFNYAAKYAYESLQSYILSTSIKPHELVKWLQGGRPSMNRDRALECARLADEKGMTEVEIGKMCNWAIQDDSYGKPTQCRTARRYIRFGRELMENQRT